MADEICFLTKDILSSKPPKKSGASLRVLVLVFALSCALYILNQARVLTIGSVHQQQLCRSKTPYLHYPKPTSFDRSGSGWFETLLNSHINVSSNGEIFLDKHRRSNVSSILSTLDRVYNLDWFTSASKNECSSAIGFKWMFNQGLMEHHKEIVDYFNSKGVTVILLFRRNLLRRMVSLLANSYDRYAKLLNGIHKSHVHSHHEADILSRYKPIINSTSLVMDLKLMHKTVLEALAHFTQTRHILLYYEDLVKNPTKLMDVQQFLGLPRMQLTSRQVKIHKGSLSDHIRNWEDVSRILQGTIYEGFLHTDYEN